MKQTILRQAITAELDELFDYRKKDRVRAFLKSHPNLIDFLQESYYYLYKFFGPNAKHILEVVSDPENNHQTLFVFIHTSLSINKALAKLDKFDDEWFLDHFDQVDGDLNFNLEAVKVI